jgi:thiosulfate reductase cytochrome b subunit
MVTSSASSELRAAPTVDTAGDSAIRAGVVRTRRLLRHTGLVRMTHWVMATSVLGLVATGSGILISHPRLYWGETGAVGTPSLIDLPLPFVIGPSVWNRPIHFFFAWGFVLGAVVYVLGGLASRHFRDDLIPARADLAWRNIASVLSAHLRWKRTAADDVGSYNAVQRLVYLVVVFVLFPGIVWTGSAMSFGVTSVFPGLATVVGGFQSVRTLHFVFASVLTIFVVVHVAMVCLVGFRSHVGAMITGHALEQGSSR